MALTDDQRALIRQWRADPVSWVRQDVGVEELDPWHVEAFRAYGSPDKIKRIAMRACVGPGKSFVEALCAIHFATFMATPHDFPTGVCLSKSRENLRDNLWKEIAKWYRRSAVAQHVLRHNNDRLYNPDHPKEWAISARSFAQKASVEEMGAALSGLHGRLVYVGLDETGAMHPIIGDRAEQALSTKDRIRHRIMSAGNPVSMSGLLYAQTEGDLRRDYYVISITGDPDDPNRASRVDPVWARRMIALRGYNSAWVRSHIRGLFPEGEWNALLTRSQVLAAMQRHPPPGTFDYDPMVYGVDVGGDGEDADPSVICRRQGLRVYPFSELYSADGYHGAQRIAALNSEHPADAMFLDGTGGWANDWNKELMKLGHEPVRVGFAEAAEERETHYNKRAEMWWRMRDFIVNGGCLPYDEELLEELTTQTYDYNGDRIVMTEKDETKSQLGQRSTNKADSLALTFAFAVNPRIRPGSPEDVRRRLAQWGHGVEDIDPYASL